MPVPKKRPKTKGPAACGVLVQRLRVRALLPRVHDYIVRRSLTSPTLHPSRTPATSHAFRRPLPLFSPIGLLLLVHMHVLEILY